MADKKNGNEDLASFEDGMPWLLLPTNVLEDDNEPEPEPEPEVPCVDDKLAGYQKQRHHHQQHQAKRQAAAAVQQNHSGWKSGHPIRPHKTRNGSTNSKWTLGGPGMQAVFLDSGKQRPGGTGVFLPRRDGSQFHSSNKPACPTVLLPSRVVQTLNLNVHELGSKQFNSRQEYAVKKSKDGRGLPSAKRSSMDARKGGSGGAGQWCSPEIFLPKEWTY